MNDHKQTRDAHRFAPGRFRRWSALIAVLISGLCTADVRVELSSDTIAQGETVQLRLEATGANLQPPDLSVLDADFTIVDRRVQRSRSVINGRSRERVGLTLFLLPKRAGDIEIPAISVGAETTHPLQLTVTASVAQIPATPESGDGTLPQTAPPWWTPPQAPWSPYGPPEPLYPGPQELAPGLLDIPLSMPPPGEPADVPSAADASTQSPSAPVTRTESQTDSRMATLKDPWFWTALILAVALVLSLIRRRRAQQPTPAEAHAPQPTRAEPPPVEPPTITAIRIAYETANATAARDALLAWGRAAFPDDPPANLVRLAQRCDEPARARITLLEQATYSPTPLEWNNAPVWEWLRSSHPGVDEVDG